MIRLCVLFLLAASVLTAAYKFSVSIQPASAPEALTAKTTQAHTGLLSDRVQQLSTSPIARSMGHRRSDSFPDVQLIDQHGHSHSFRQDLVRDKIVCIAFFYTQCTGTCPGTIQTMKRLRETIRNEFPPDSVRFLAVSLTPEEDRPEDLMKYASDRGIVPAADLAEWLFCTGTLDDVEQLRRGLGLYELDPELDADRTQHAALLTIGNDRTNRWTALPSGLSYDDLSETFFRIAGTTERQRFETRIARSAQFIPTAVTAAPPALSCCNGTKKSKSAVNKEECCSKPQANP